MSALNFSQQQGLFDPQRARPVTVIGAGAVGSQVAILLPKLGVTDLTVVDADTIESHNVANSAYGCADLAHAKVEALAARVLADTGLIVRQVPTMYAGGQLNGTVVACVDSMEARQIIWKQVRDNPNVDLLVDTRTAEQLISVFAIRPCEREDIAFYEYYLRYKTAQAVVAMCGVHGLITESLLAASLAGRNLTTFWQTGKVWQRHRYYLDGRDVTEVA